MRRESFEGNVTILNDVIDINNYIKQNPVMLACVLSSAVIGEAAFMSFAKRKRGSLATHILDEVGDALNTLSPVADVM